MDLLQYLKEEAFSLPCLESTTPLATHSLFTRLIRFSRRTFPADRLRTYFDAVFYTEGRDRWISNYYLDVFCILNLNC